MKSKQFLNKIAQFGITIPVLIFIYLPILWLVVSSISTRADLLSTPPTWIPAHPTLKNYIDIFTPGSSTSEVSRTFKVTLLNSFLVASTVTVISLVVGSLAAYSLARIRFPFRRGVMLTILGTRMIPEISMVIPLVYSGIPHQYTQHTLCIDSHLPCICAAFCNLVVDIFL